MGLSKKRSLSDFTPISIQKRPFFPKKRPFSLNKRGANRIEATF